jgi:hypothetical protein
LASCGRAGNVLAEFEGPQRERSRKPERQRQTAQRSGHGRWLRTIMRGALTESRRRSNFQRIGFGIRPPEGDGTRGKHVRGRPAFQAGRVARVLSAC